MLTRLYANQLVTMHPAKREWTLQRDHPKIGRIIPQKNRQNDAGKRAPLSVRCARIFIARALPVCLSGCEPVADASQFPTRALN